MSQETSSNPTWHFIHVDDGRYAELRKGEAVLATVWHGGSWCAWDDRRSPVAIAHGSSVSLAVAKKDAQLWLLRSHPQVLAECQPTHRDYVLLEVPCRRCPVCEDSSHHWMEGFDEDESGELVDPGDPRWQCKHCDFSMPYGYGDMDTENPEAMYQARCQAQWSDVWPTKEGLYWVWDPEIPDIEPGVAEVMAVGSKHTSWFFSGEPILVSTWPSLRWGSRLHRPATPPYLATQEKP